MTTYSVQYDPVTGAPFTIARAKASQCETVELATVSAHSHEAAYFTEQLKDVLEQHAGGDNALLNRTIAFAAAGSKPCALIALNGIVARASSPPLLTHVSFSQLSKPGPLDSDMRGILDDKTTTARAAYPNKYVDLGVIAHAGSRRRFVIAPTGGVLEGDIDSRTWPGKLQLYYTVRDPPSEWGFDLDLPDGAELLLRITTEKRSKERCMDPETQSAHDHVVCAAIGVLIGGVFTPSNFREAAGSKHKAWSSVPIYSAPKGGGDSTLRAKLFNIKTWPAPPPQAADDEDGAPLPGSELRARERWQFISCNDPCSIAIVQKDKDGDSLFTLCNFNIARISNIYRRSQGDDVWILECHTTIGKGSREVFIGHTACGAARTPDMTDVATLIVEVETTPSAWKSIHDARRQFMNAANHLILTGMKIEHLYSFIAEKLEVPTQRRAIDFIGRQSDGVYVFANCAMLPNGEVVSLEETTFAFLRSRFVGAAADTALVYTEKSLPRLCICPCPWAQYYVLNHLVHDVLERQFQGNSCVAFLTLASVCFSLNASSFFSGDHGLGHGVPVVYLLGRYGTGKTESLYGNAAMLPNSSTITGALRSATQSPAQPRHPHHPTPPQASWSQRSQCPPGREGTVPDAPRSRAQHQHPYPAERRCRSFAPPRRGACPTLEPESHCPSRPWSPRPPPDPHPP
jgi:hypothetical protein